MPVPNIFGTATSAIPLSQLDTNFATPVTIGNTAVQLGNTVTSFGNVTLTNVTISSGNVTVSAGSNTAPSITTVGDTNTGIFFPAADTIAFSEGGVESMRIDSDGDVGIGTSSPAFRLHSYGGAVTNPTNFYSQGYVANGAVDTRAGTIRNAFDSNSAFGTYWTAFRAANGSSYQARFGVASGSGDVDVMTLDGTGNLLVGVTSSYFSEKLTVQGPAASSPPISFFYAPFASYTGTNLYVQSEAASGTTWKVLSGRSATGTERIAIYGNGNIQNTNNSYGALSDIKLKENIVDATPKLADLMQVKVRNYNLIGETTKQIGVVAQELEQLFPSMIEEIPDRDEKDNILDTTTKSVKYSVFVPMLVKAIQEQQSLITALTARITALETLSAEGTSNGS